MNRTVWLVLLCAGMLLLIVGLFASSHPTVKHQLDLWRAALTAGVHSASEAVSQAAPPAKPAPEPAKPSGPDAGEVRTTGLLEMLGETMDAVPPDTPTGVAHGTGDHAREDARDAARKAGEADRRVESGSQ